MNNDPDQLKEFSQKVLERDGEYERMKEHLRDDDDDDNVNISTICVPEREKMDLGKRIFTEIIRTCKN